MFQIKTKTSSLLFAAFLGSALTSFPAFSQEPSAKRKYPDIDITQVDTDEEATSVYLQLLEREDDLNSDRIRYSYLKSKQLSKIKLLKEQYSQTNDAIVRASIRKKIVAANKLLRKIKRNIIDTRKQDAQNERKKTILELEYPYLNFGDWFL